MGSIKLSEAARQNIREANQKKFSRSLDDVVKDIRKERKARQIRAIQRMLEKK